MAKFAYLATKASMGIETSFVDSSKHLSIVEFALAALVRMSAIDTTEIAREKMNGCTQPEILFGQEDLKGGSWPIAAPP